MRPDPVTLWLSIAIAALTCWVLVTAVRLILGGKRQTDERGNWPPMPFPTPPPPKTSRSNRGDALILRREEPCDACKYGEPCDKCLGVN